MDTGLVDWDNTFIYIAHCGLPVIPVTRLLFTQVVTTFLLLILVLRTLFVGGPRFAALPALPTPHTRYAHTTCRRTHTAHTHTPHPHTTATALLPRTCPAPTTAPHYTTLTHTPPHHPPTPAHIYTLHYALHTLPYLPRYTPTHATCTPFTCWTRWCHHHAHHPMPIPLPPHAPTLLATPTCQRLPGQDFCV